MICDTAADSPDDSFLEAMIDDLKITDHDDGVRFTLGGSTKIGQTALLAMTALRSKSRSYVVGASFGERPGIAVDGPRTIPLNLDPLFLSAWALPSTVSPAPTKRVTAFAPATVANVAVGYGLAVLTQVLIFPWFSLPVRIMDSLAIGGIFTVVSIVRSYVLRRIFEGLC